MPPIDGHRASPEEPRITPPNPTDAHAPKPLAGLRVIDFSQNLAGPYATQILADMGADVVKVEPPGGDPARRWGPPFAAGQSHLFQVVNRNKRAVALDLKDARDRGRARDLATEADVVVQAFRHGAAERLGVGYERIRATNPRVIYASVTAHGMDGPLAEQPGYDPLMQARSGLMSVTGEPEGGPVRVGASVIDLGTGMWTATAILSALINRYRTGTGCHVSTSLLDTSLAWMSYHLTAYLATGVAPGPMGTSIAMIAPYEAFPCRDGQVMVAAGNDQIFCRLCEGLRLQVADHPNYRTNEARVTHRGRLAEIIAERTGGMSQVELLELLHNCGVPAAPIHSVPSALLDPQTAATGMVRGAPHPDMENYIDIPTPIRWDGRRAPLRRHPPAIAEHQDEVFSPEGSSPGTRSRWPKPRP